MPKMVQELAQYFGLLLTCFNVRSSVQTALKRDTAMLSQKGGIVRVRELVKSWPDAMNPEFDKYSTLWATPPC